jgi:hypothetical protein
MRTCASCGMRRVTKSEQNIVYLIFWFFAELYLVSNDRREGSKFLIGAFWRSDSFEVRIFNFIWLAFICVFCVR